MAFSRWTKIKKDIALFRTFEYNKDNIPTGWYFDEWSRA